MLNFKGFANYATLYDNAPGVINLIGELSTDALTYTKEKGLYGNKTINPSLGITSFVCEEDNVPVILDNTSRDQILEICDFMYQLTITKSGQGLDHGDFANGLVTEFSKVVSDIRVGEIKNDGSFWMPEWVSFKLRAKSSMIHIWFVEERFRYQFPDYEIVISPPLIPLDNFFKPANEVKALLDEVTTPVVIESLQKAKDGYPETVLRIDEFHYHNPYDATDTYPSLWGSLIYGLAGNNLDAIKNALIDYILANSNKSRDEWAEIFPEIFKKNEFVLIPVWNKYAIPNLITQTGLHSQVLSAKEITDLATQVAEDYPVTHTKNNATATGFPYRGLGLVSIGHIENKDNLYRIDQVFPDWINTSTNQDFNRMSERTKTWHMKLLETIHLAESFEEHGVIPTDLMRETRDGRIYLSWTYERRNYLVLCKISANGL